MNYQVSCRIPENGSHAGFGFPVTELGTDTRTYNMQFFKTSYLEGSLFKTSKIYLEASLVTVTIGANYQVKVRENDFSKIPRPCMSSPKTDASKFDKLTQSQ